MTTYKDDFANLKIDGFTQKHADQVEGIYQHADIKNAYLFVSKVADGGKCGDHEYKASLYFGELGEAGNICAKSLPLSKDFSNAEKAKEAIVMAFEQNFSSKKPHFISIYNTPDSLYAIKFSTKAKDLTEVQEMFSRIFKPLLASDGKLREVIDFGATHEHTMGQKQIQSDITAQNLFKGLKKPSLKEKNNCAEVSKGWDR